MSITNPVKKTLSILLVLVIFVILGRMLYLNGEALLRYEWRFRYHFLFASFLFLTLNYLIAAYAWTFILKGLGFSLDFAQSFKITYLSAVGKYIPGRIWSYMSQIYLAEREGLPIRLTLVSMLLMFVSYNGIAILFFISTLLLWENITASLVLVSVPFFSFILLFVSHPQVLSKAINSLLRVFGKEKLEFKFSYKHTLLLLGLLILDRLIFSTFSYLFINSFLVLDLASIIRFSGIFSIAVFLGMITFITPGGLGVREGVQSYLLSLFIPISMAILIPLAMRVCMSLGELVCFVSALKIRKTTLPCTSPAAKKTEPHSQALSLPPAKVKL